MNKKAEGEMQLNKIIGLIIMILVLLAVLMLILKPDALDWIKNQPMFAPPVDQTKELSQDQVKVLNYELIGIAKVEKRKDTAFQQYFVYINDTNGYVKSPVYWQVGSDANGDIKVSKAWSIDPTIGSVKNYFFLIDFNKYSAEKNLFPREDLMLKLNGSKYIGGYLYKTKTTVSSIITPALSTPTSVNIVETQQAASIASSTNKPDVRNIPSVPTN